MSHQTEPQGKSRNDGEESRNELGISRLPRWCYWIFPLALCLECPVWFRLLLKPAGRGMSGWEAAILLPASWVAAAVLILAIVRSPGFKANPTVSEWFREWTSLLLLKRPAWEDLWQMLRGIVTAFVLDPSLSERHWWFKYYYYGALLFWPASAVVILAIMIPRFVIEVKRVGFPRQLP